jgi:hypothetical protein
MIKDFELESVSSKKFYIFLWMINSSKKSEIKKDEFFILKDR